MREILGLNRAGRKAIEVALVDSPDRHPCFRENAYHPFASLIFWQVLGALFRRDASGKGEPQY
jgi:hypothetical protein